MTASWRTLSDEEMERQFNPRAAVADTQERIDAFVSRSAAVRERVPGEYDLRFGSGPKETLDVHRTPGASGRPLVMFIHGGYWRGLDKSDHSFVVEPLLATGAVVANINYDLCPDIDLDEMVAQIGRAVRFCHGSAADWGADPQDLHLVGHSAGAHLAAEMLLGALEPAEPAAAAVRSLAGLTGIYEPEVILRVSVNEEAQIAPETARAHDCLTRPLRLRPRVVLAAGDAEPPGWIAQSRAFAGACIEAGLDTRYLGAPGCNHFTVLEEAIEPGTPLHAAVTGLWARDRA